MYTGGSGSIFNKYYTKKLLKRAEVLLYCLLYIFRGKKSRGVVKLGCGTSLEVQQPMHIFRRQKRPF